MSYNESKRANASSICADNSSRIVRSPFGYELSSSKVGKPPGSMIDFLINLDHVNRFNQNLFKGVIVIYVGMDISSKDFVIYAIDEREEIKFKGSIKPSREGLRELIAKLGKQKKLFVFEAGNQMKWIADFFKQQKQDYHVVHPNEIKWITANQGKKTDKVDAKKLAKLARLNALPRRVLVVDGKARDLRELINAREALQNKRIDLQNLVRGYAKQEGIKLPLKFFNSNDWQVKLEKLEVSKTVKTVIACIVNSTEKIQAEEAELLKEIIKIESKEIELIETIPAIGKLTSRIIYAAIVDAKRFDNKKSVANYGALTPTIYQSGNTVHMGAINRDGRKEVRKALLQCAHCVTRMKTASVKPLKDFYERIEKRRGKKRAVVAVARKLLTVAYGVMKSGKVYDPQVLAA